jgi:hypothetical protein
MVIITGSKIVGAGARAGTWIIAMVLLAVLAGCSPALKMNLIWEDEGYYSGHPQKVLVMCDMTVPTMKRAFENEFVKFLRHQGLQAVESFRIIPEGVPTDSKGRDALVALIKEQGFDSVLYTRTMTGRSETRDVPGMTIVTGFGSPYGYGGYGGVGVAATIGGPSQPTTQGYSHEQNYLTIETQLFDARTEKRLWASQTELRLSGSPEKNITPYVSMVTDKLTKSKFFK